MAEPLFHTFLLSCQNWDQTSPTILHHLLVWRLRCVNSKCPLKQRWAVGWSGDLLSLTSNSDFLFSNLSLAPTINQTSWLLYTTILHPARRFRFRLCLLVIFYSSIQFCRSRSGVDSRIFTLNNTVFQHFHWFLRENFMDLNKKVLSSKKRNRKFEIQIKICIL